jgi:hypothetical protein
MLAPQQTTTPAPQAPQIPALPARPGAGTGGAAPTPQAPPTIDARDQLRTEIQTQIRDAVQTATAAAGQAGEAVILQPPRSPNNDIPPEVIPIVGIVFGTLAAMVLLTPIIRFVTRVLEKRMDRSLVSGEKVGAQLQQLQTSLDTLAIEVERISEAQRFQAKLMVERDRAALPEGRGGA